MKNLWLFNEGRIAILRKLFKCDSANGCELRKVLSMKKPLLSHHIKILREKGLIKEKKVGREKFYSINPQKRIFVKEIIKLIN
jgi:DNA-binding transcriptional ArsR family regulator